MKKFMALLLTAVTTLTLVTGCSTNSSKETTAATTQAATTAAEQTTQAAEQTTQAAEQTTQASENKETKIIVDGYGEEVEVPANIDSIVASMWPVPSVIFAVTGRADMIKTMAPGSMEAYPISMFSVLAPGLDNVPTDCLNSSTDMNFEELAKVEPKVVLGNQTVYDELGDQIRAIGATPVRFKFGEFTDVQELIRIIGELFDCEERAQSLINYHKETLAYLESKVAEQPADEDKLTVLYIQRASDGEYSVVCPKHLGDKYITLAGGIDATAELTDVGTTTKVSIEQILAWNPDVILLSNFQDFVPEDFVNGEYGEEWALVNAVKNKRIYKTPIGIYRWDTQNIEAPYMVEWLAKILNPEIYTEFDLIENLKGFYKEYYDYDLTDEDLNRILSQDANIYLDFTEEKYGKAQ